MTVTDPRTDGATPIQPTDVTAADFRHAIGHFATGVTVVTSVDADGQPVGTTANAVSSLSLDPPLILVCFDRSSKTLESVRAHGAFAVNVLGARQQHLSTNFARRGLAAAWDGVRHRCGRTGSPRLDGVIATLECTVEHQLEGGDHEIIVGRVREVETSGDDAAPLIFWRGRYLPAQQTGLPGSGASPFGLKPVIALDLPTDLGHLAAADVATGAADQVE